MNTMRNQSGIDMRDRDKNKVNGVGLLAVFAKRAGSVEKTLVMMTYQQFPRIRYVTLAV